MSFIILRFLIINNIKDISIKNKLTINNSIMRDNLLAITSFLSRT